MHVEVRVATLRQGRRQEDGHPSGCNQNGADSRSWSQLGTLQRKAGRPFDRARGPVDKDSHHSYAGSYHPVICDVAPVRSQSPSRLSSPLFKSTLAIGASSPLCMRLNCRAFDNTPFTSPGDHALSAPSPLHDVRRRAYRMVHGRLFVATCCRAEARRSSHATRQTWRRHGLC